MRKCFLPHKAQVGVLALLLLFSFSACSAPSGQSDHSQADNHSARADSAEDVLAEQEAESDDGRIAAPEVGATTVASASVTPDEQQQFFLWEVGNVPHTTDYTVNDRGYFDDPDFRPYLTSYPVPEGTEVKGAVLICSGGAFQFRSDQPEGVEVAEALSERGYQSFVVDYRLRPYTQQEGAVDLARAVRFVRAPR